MRHPETALRWTAIAALEVVAAIHVSMAMDHIGEKFYVGVLFCIGSAALTGAALALATDGGRTLIGQTLAWLTAAAVSLGMFGGYLASRTTGLPLGYHEEFSLGYENILGYVALVLETVAIGCALVALSRLWQARTADPVITGGAGAAGPMVDALRRPDAVNWNARAATGNRQP